VRAPVGPRGRRRRVLGLGRVPTPLHMRERTVVKQGLGFAVGAQVGAGQHREVGEPEEEEFEAEPL
jgi:hypothetical protein